MLMIEERQLFYSTNHANSDTIESMLYKIKD